MNELKTINYSAYCYDNLQKRIIHRKIKRLTFLDLACNSHFECMKIDGGHYLEYTAVTEDVLAYGLALGDGHDIISKMDS